MGYIDSNWEGSVVDKKKYSRVIHQLEIKGCLMVHPETKVSCFVEAEYMVASLATYEYIWLRKMLVNLFGWEMV